MAAAVETPAPRKQRATQVGVVTSDMRDKTIRVEVAFQVRHAKYGKFLRRAIVLHVHDPANEAHVGDRVEIAECRPISKTKHWRLVRVLHKAAGGAT